MTDTRALIERLRASAEENHEMLDDIHLLLSEAADALEARLPTVRREDKDDLVDVVARALSLSSTRHVNKHDWARNILWVIADRIVPEGHVAVPVEERQAIVHLLLEIDASDSCPDLIRRRARDYQFSFGMPARLRAAAEGTG